MNDDRLDRVLKEIQSTRVINSNIVIKYEDSYSVWLNKIKNGLKDHNINTNNRLPNLILESLIKTVTAYLVDMKYKPNDTPLYRLGLSKRLAKFGMYLSIRSNDTLWKYLEYFNDLEDYSNCFDIEIVIKDLEKASKDVIGVFADSLEMTKSIYNSESKSLLKQISDLKTNNKDENMSKILDILEILIKRSDIK